MNKYKDTFKNKYVLLPVIHAENINQTLRNMDIAFNTGCDGVFLINHRINFKGLQHIFKKVQQEYKDFWIGLNYLDIPTSHIFFNVNDSTSGIWTDNAYADDKTKIETSDKTRKLFAPDWQGLYFGGVAFKYQKPVPINDLIEVTKTAKKYMDVITTSGTGTGIPAEIEKIKTMKHAAGDTPIALASGITPGNVEIYLDVADCFLVSTGISNSFTELNRNKVKSLIDKIR